MKKIEGKVYLEYSDCEKVKDDINSFMKGKINIVAPFRGGLPLGVKLSNVLNSPLSIVEYQRYDGNSKEVNFIKDNIDVNLPILIVDDIVDEGITMKKVYEFMHTKYPESEIKVYSIVGSKEHNPEWKYSFEHNGEWVVFPWEV